MKLMTRQIRTSLKNCHSDMQLTLEDDINVPDSKPDIEHIIKIQGEIHVQETSAETDRAIIRGQLSFSLLYLSDVDFRQIHTMQGQIPFEESINLENANPDLEVHCHYDLEDCRASLINFVHYDGNRYSLQYSSNICPKNGSSSSFNLSKYSCIS